jgi:hypothetical protein
MNPWAIPPDLWAGETVAIIAGGWSVTKDDVAYVAASGCKTMVINRSWELLPTADWLHGCDGEFWQFFRETAGKFAGIKTTLDPSSAVNGVRWLRRCGEDGFDPRPGHVREGGNSTYQGMHCAIQAGSKAIVLLGVDMCRHPVTAKTHWHTGWHRGSQYDQMIPQFATLKPVLKERGIDVVNTSAQSALECFPKVPLREAL